MVKFSCDNYCKKNLQVVISKGNNVLPQSNPKITWKMYFSSGIFHLLKLFLEIFESAKETRWTHSSSLKLSFIWKTIVDITAVSDNHAVWWLQAKRKLGLYPLRKIISDSTVLLNILLRHWRKSASYRLTTSTAVGVFWATILKRTVLQRLICPRPTTL